MEGTMAKPNMPTVETKNVVPPPSNPQGGAVASGQWKAACTDCCASPGHCLCSWCCPCCVYGDIKGGMNGSTERNTGSCVGYCIISACNCGWVLGCMNRGEVRQKHGISGSCIGDMICHCCCSPCALEQEYKQTRP
mmetsp:Transcript_71250/g.98987  ORF Transcript_71250/g.98987 Transcript_71250/m.98987 type:complete len:136 (-) Transcript_71250:389-796(-)